VKRRVFPNVKQSDVTGKRVEAGKEENHQTAVVRGEPDYFVLIDLVVIREIVERVVSVDDMPAGRLYVLPQFELRVRAQGSIE